MALLKLVTVIITIFTRETNHFKLRDYIKNCIATGSIADLFKDPKILAAFYAAGTFAYNALKGAIDVWELDQTEDNLKIVKDKMALAVIWLRGYASQVQVIANDPANCTTREEAATNIALSFLKAQKLTKTKKGNPDSPAFSASITNGVINIKITNGPAYKPTTINFIAVPVPPVTVPATPLPVVTLDRANGQVSVASKVGIKTVTKSVSGKGQSAKIANMNYSPSYNLYSYAMNGNKQISDLSAPILVTIIDPETV